MVEIILAIATLCQVTGTAGNGGWSFATSYADALKQQKSCQKKYLECVGTGTTSELNLKLRDCVLKGE